MPTGWLANARFVVESKMFGPLTMEVGSETLLLATLGSGSAAETLALLTMFPNAVGVTAIVETALAPLARLGMVQVTTPAACVQPAEAETNVTPAGRVSVTTTLVAGEGPKFAAVTV